MVNMKILELYSGIGGMHVALNLSEVKGEVVCAIDINTVANSVYSFNFKNKVINGNIQSLTPKFINNMGINTVLMSPPCQPFTRNGLMKDMCDARTNSLVYFLDILPQLKIENLLLENVKGFETSEMHKKLIDVLIQLKFHIKEFLVCPTEYGVPNSRCRYYCVASKREFNSNVINIANDSIELFSLDEILDKDEDVTNKYDISIEVLRKHYKLIDIVYGNSIGSCCFTKSYSRYIEGTGSVLSKNSRDEIGCIYQKLDEIEKENFSDDALKLAAMDEELSKLKLRFFTPKEVSRLMCFPENYGFPPSVSTKQKYKLLGNSINCRVVAELIKILQ